MGNPVESLPYASGGPAGHGNIKLRPEDFIVEEILGFEPSGDGEHVFIKIEKRGENTEYLARQLARFAGVSSRYVSYAGLKDRHGATVQWFSIQLPGKTEPDWTDFESDTIRVLDTRRNSRKLRKGAAAGNRFELTIRALDADVALLESRLADIARKGVPNYFGPQRFGHEGQNVEGARQMFADPDPKLNSHTRGLYLSAARSIIFNKTVAGRIAAGNWDKPIKGDVFMFSSSRSFFTTESVTDEIRDRTAASEIHPSGVLWGTRPSTASADALEIELDAVSHFRDLADGLEKAGIETSRRPLRVCPSHMTWSIDTEQNLLCLGFTLPSGAYATTILRECLQTEAVDG